MSEKRLVVTFCNGEIHNAIGAVTHPFMKRYAERCKADFEVISEHQGGEIPPHWEKLKIGGLLAEYDRIVYMDTDMLVRSDTPNLFDVVVPDCIGAFRESDVVERRMMFNDYLDNMQYHPQHWDGHYYNTGLLVVSRNHAKVFQVPELEEVERNVELKKAKPGLHFHDQSYLNWKIIQNKHVVQPLPHVFNHMHVLGDDAWAQRHESFIIHYAGLAKALGLTHALDVVKRDAKKWSESDGTKEKGHEEEKGREEKTDEAESAAGTTEGSQDRS